MTVWNHLRTTPKWVSDSWEEYFSDPEGDVVRGGNSEGIGYSLGRNEASFEGTAAKEFFAGLQNEYNNGSEDGSWSFSVGMNKNGNFGYWGNPFMTPGADGMLGGVGFRFISLIDGPGPGKRPDADGYLTYSEANYWRHYGNGQSLYVDINKIELPIRFTVEEFKKSNYSVQGHKAILANFDGKDFVNSTQALVYGSMTFVLFEDNTIMAAFPDSYNFDIKLAEGSFVRDFATMVGNLAADYANPGGNSYLIWIYGSRKIPLK